MRDRRAAEHARNPRRAPATQRCPTTPREETGIRHADARPANDIGGDTAASAAEGQLGARGRYRVGGCSTEGDRPATPRENHGGATVQSDATRISVRVAVTGDRRSEARRAQCAKLGSPSTRASRFSRGATTSQHQLKKRARSGCLKRANAMDAGDFRGQPRGTRHPKCVGICRGLEKTRVTQSLTAAGKTPARSSARRACRRAGLRGSRLRSRAASRPPASRCQGLVTPVSVRLQDVPADARSVQRRGLILETPGARGTEPCCASLRSPAVGLLLTRRNAPSTHIFLARRAAHDLMRNGNTSSPQQRPASRQRAHRGQDVRPNTL